MNKAKQRLINKNQNMEQNDYHYNMTKGFSKCGLGCVVNWFIWIIVILLIWGVAKLTKHYLDEYADVYLLFIGWVTCSLWQYKT